MAIHWWPARSSCRVRWVRWLPLCRETGFTPTLPHLERCRWSLHRKGWPMRKTNVAIIGSGNIGTDLMMKVLRLSESLEVVAMVGIDAESDGLARARRLKIPTTANGVDGLTAMPGFDEIEIVFDA